MLVITFIDIALPRIGYYIMTSKCGKTNTVNNEDEWFTFL